MFQADMSSGETVGIWGGSVPKCVKACTYPGTAIGGMIDKVQFYYPVESTVKFDCVAGLQMKGARMIKCMPDGSWSSSVPTCQKPGDDNSDTRRR